MKWISYNIKTALISLFLSLVVISLPACSGKQNIRLGQQYASAGDWDKSVQVYQEALDKDPDDQEIKLLLFRSKKNASLAHQTRGEALLADERFDEAITEFQMGIAFDSSNIKAESLLKKASAMKESEYYLKMGLNLEKGQNFSHAKESIQKALTLNPDNTAARDALARYMKKEERPLSKYPVKIDKEKPISLKFKNTPILNVFEVLTRLTGVNFIFDKDVKETKVTFFLSNVSFDEFIEIFLRTNQLSASLVNEKTMIIYPDTSQKAKEYQDLQIKTFYLAHLDVKNAVTLLTKILNSKDISANETLNSLVIRAPKEVIKVASKILEANDRPSSEVTFNVEILEVTRTKEKQLGLDFNPTSLTGTLGGPTSDFYTPGSTSAPVSGGASVEALRRTRPENMLVSIPTATLNLMKRDGDTKTLAKPQIRVKNGEKAKIHIGERIPLRTNRRTDTSGAITYDYQYQDVGIKLNVEPIINLYDEITLSLTLEISSIGENIGTADDPQYSIKTRTAESVMNVRAGESVIIGGLISDEERKTIRKVPLMGDIPIFGYLFSSYDTDDIQQDILMAITPIIIRGQEIPEPSISQIWSGKESDFSLKGPYEAEHDMSRTLLDRPRDDVGMEKENFEDMEPSPSGIPAPFSDDEGPVPSLLPSELPPDDFPEEFVDEPPPLSIEQNTEHEPLSSVKPEGTANPPAITASNEPRNMSSLSSSWPETLPYTIQISSYANRSDAEEQVERLKQKEYDCFLNTGYVPSKGGTFYRVFIGKYGSYKEAERNCKAMKQQDGFTEDIYVVNRSWAIGG